MFQIAMISPGMSSCEYSLNTLRYADSVKELASNDPTKIKMSSSSEEKPMKVEDVGAQGDSDHTQLQSLNVSLLLSVVTFLILICC
jgi:kinesin family protein 2/24